MIESLNDKSLIWLWQELVPEIHVKVKDRLKLYSKTSDAATEEMTLVTNDVIGRLDKDNKITVTTPVLLVCNYVEGLSTATHT